MNIVTPKMQCEAGHLKFYNINVDSSDNPVLVTFIFDIDMLLQQLAASRPTTTTVKDTLSISLSDHRCIV